MVGNDVQHAAQELLKRRLARRHMLDFVRYTMPEYRAGEHHARICSALEDVRAGKCDRLILMAPPRHGKSQLVSRHFPAWILGVRPKSQIILASYGQDLANDFGRDIRGLVSSPEYSALFPKVRLDDTSRSVNRFHTTAGGVVYAVGVGSAVTGRGADFAIVDDPIRNREDADSPVVQKAVWDWYTSTLFTRLMPGASLILMMTRWAENDLAGKLLEAMNQQGERWRVLEMPAIENEGTDDEQALWPDWYDLESLKRIRNTIGPRDWSALYQQRPASDEGDFFKREWLKSYKPSDKPERLNVYITSDFAVTEGRGDYTCHVVWGVDLDHNLYALDCWRGQSGPDVWIDALLALVRKYRPLRWFGEAGVIRRAIEPILKRRQQELGVYCATEWIPSMRDKETRARAFQSRAAIGAVFFPDSAPWLDACLDELVRFPAAKHDDFVDCCSMIGSRVSALVSATIETSPARPRVRDYGFGDTESDESTTWRTF